MSEQILHVATPEQLAILAPHIERLNRAEAEVADAKRVIVNAARAFWPGALVPGVRFDTTRLAVVRSIEEVSDGDA